MRAPDRPSAFTGDNARDKYFTAYGRVLGELWPVPVEAIDVETRAGSVRIHRAGPAEGDPVVLLAGADGNALAWYRYIEPLARMRPVFAVDPLGEPGRSVQTRPLATGAEVAGWLTDEQVRELSVPVQVLLGARSAVHDARAVAARLAEIAPSWRVEIVPDTGHALPVEAPDLITERILTFPGQTRAEIATPVHSTDRG
ncbi:alpha/beta fold hydrolase [Streptosporangium canum]|uniref:alpha/beta fold hydrolase n=1 Tax=Streptosporangium canum TaxID=324952 RepID=UPI00378F9C43